MQPEKPISPPATVPNNHRVSQKGKDGKQNASIQNTSSTAKEVVDDDDEKEESNQRHRRGGKFN